jgi:diguanylate cyclase (GGDEF)-like protein/PAS domain S-box-containing protein
MNENPYMRPSIFHKSFRFGAWTRLALPWQLAVYLACVLPLLWLSIVLLLQQLHDRTLEEARKDASNLVSGLSEEVHSSVHAIDLTLLDLRERWQEEPQSFSTKVRSRQAHLEEDVAFQVGILSAQGMLLYSSADPNAKVRDFSDREHFRVHADARDTLFISKPVFGRVSQRWSLQFTRRLADAQGAFAGVIVLSVAPEHFMRFSRQIDLGKHGAIALSRASGQILARSPAPATGFGETVRDMPAYSSLISNTVSFERTSQFDGISRLYAWRALPTDQLIVSVGRSMDDVLEPYFRQRTILTAGGAGVSVLLALIGYIVLSNLRHRTAARAALEESEFRWKYALEGAGEGVWDWNGQTGEAFYSKRWKEMLGYGELEIDSSVQGWEQLIHPDDKVRVEAANLACIAGNTQVYAEEYRLRCKDQSWKWVSSRGMVIRRDARGQALRMIGVQTDINERKRSEEAEREYLSNYDSLTGLANRNLLCDRIGEAIAATASRAQPIWIVCINLDRFKFINDTLGHEAGNAALQLVAGRLQASLHASGTVARAAGDEFVLVLAEGVDEDTVTSTVQRIMENVGLPLTIEEHDYSLSCTVGISMYPADGGDADTLIRNANIAMHRAKEVGRNSFQFYTACMNERAMDRLRLESDLRHALGRNELMLHYQPQVDLRTGRIVGTEALLRWLHPQLGLVPPDRFIRIAEETGIIVPIGAWVMHTACRQTREWQKAGFGNLRISVNLSGNQLYQSDLIASVEEILRDTGLDAQSLDIELTESLVMTDVENALGIMHQLKRLGVKLSLDDFGTGYSSLSYLKRLPIDVLKIDKSFVRNITTDPDEAAIARSIITLAQSLQMQVIAEGVETAPQLGYLRRHRCDQIQGFYFSKPLPPHELEQLLIEDKCLPPGEAAGTHLQTLLLVDDEVHVTAALIRVLRRDGYRILRAESAEEGLRMLALHEVQVVLSDHLMPGMHGIEFLSKVKALYPDTVRMMLSGYTAVDSIIAAINSGAVFRFHAKPWDADTLRASIAEAFRYHWFIQRAANVPDPVSAVESKLLAHEGVNGADL